MFLQCRFERIVGSPALLRAMVFKIFFEIPFHSPGFWSVSGSFSVTWLSQRVQWEVMAEVLLVSLAQQGCFAVLEFSFKVSVLWFL